MKQIESSLCKYIYMSNARPQCSGDQTYANYRFQFGVTNTQHKVALYRATNFPIAYMHIQKALLFLLQCCSVRILARAMFIMYTPVQYKGTLIYIHGGVPLTFVKIFVDLGQTRNTRIHAPRRQLLRPAISFCFTLDSLCVRIDKPLGSIIKVYGFFFPLLNLQMTLL